jgi:hypothetical protein
MTGHPHELSWAEAADLAAQRGDHVKERAFRLRAEDEARQRRAAEREDAYLDRYNAACAAWESGGCKGPRPVRPGDEESALYRQLHDDRLAEAEAERDAEIANGVGGRGMILDEARRHIDAVVEYDHPDLTGPPTRGVLREVGRTKARITYLDGSARLVEPRWLTLVRPSPWVGEVKRASARLRTAADAVHAAEGQGLAAYHAVCDLRDCGVNHPDLAVVLADWLQRVADGDGLGVTYHADEAVAQDIAGVVLRERP